MSWSNPGTHTPRPSPALAVFLGGVVLSLLCWRVAEDRVQLDAVSKVDAAISDATDAIQDRLRSTYDVLYGVQGLFRATEKVSREEFERFLTGLNLPERHPTIRTINFSQRIASAEKDEFVARVRADRGLLSADYPEFTIKPGGGRPEYLPIVYIWPSAGNQNAYGLDILSEERRESAERARDRNEPVLSARLTLATDPTRQAAFSVRLPIYRRDAPIGTIEERRNALSGMLSATFLATTLVGDVLSHAALGPMAIRLYDLVEIDGAKRFGALDTEYLLYEKAPARPVQATDRHYFTRDIPIEIGGRRWQLRFQGLTHDYMTRTDRLLPWILLVGGLVVSALFAGLIRSLASARERAHSLAARITQDLRDSEAKLAEAQRLTQAMIEALPNPIFFKGTDGKYAGVNKAWEQFFGIARSAFIGKTVYDLYHADQALAERMDALDQALWQRPGSQSYEAVIPSRRRHAARRRTTRRLTRGPTAMSPASSARSSTSPSASRPSGARPWSTRSRAYSPKRRRSLMRCPESYRPYARPWAGTTAIVTNTTASLRCCGGVRCGASIRRRSSRLPSRLRTGPSSRMPQVPV